MVRNPFKRSVPVPAAVLARASVATVALTSAAAGRSLDELVPWHGRLEPLRSLLASSLAEQLIHGYDLARALGAPWDIPRREAALVLGNITPLRRCWPGFPPATGRGCWARVMRCFWSRATMLLTIRLGSRGSASNAPTGTGTRSCS